MGLAPRPGSGTAYGAMRAEILKSSQIPGVVPPAAQNAGGPAVVSGRAINLAQHKTFVL